MMEGMSGGGGTCATCCKCKCMHHKFVPGLVFLFGALFLLHNLGYVASGFVDLAWPSLVALAGLSKLSSGMCKCC